MHNKKLLVIAVCLLTSMGCMQAQVTEEEWNSDTSRYYSTRTRTYLSEQEGRGLTRGFALGADRDSMEYIVASPFDNWYIEFGGGIQTYIGNELLRSARWNKLNYNLYAELGKWVIPDLAVSLFVSHFDMSSQSKYMRNPYIDFNSQPNDNGYWNTHAFAFSIGGLLTLDWTNLLLGYDAGKNRKFHVTTPVGLGYMFNIGDKINSREDVEEPLNQEFFATAGLHFDYYATSHTIITANLRGTLTRESFDYSPYSNLYTSVDIMPAATIGIRFNLFREIYLPYGENIVIQEVNHEFLPAHSLKITDRQRLRELRDRLASAMERGDMLEADRDALLDSIDSLRNVVVEVEEDPSENPMADLYEIALRRPQTSAIVYFQLDRYNLDYNARRTLQNFATRISDHEEYPADNVYYLVGSADDSTGTARHNWGLSIHRSGSVYNQLTKVHHIPARQLEQVYLGGIHEYSPKQLNRVCIVILKDERSTAIVNKWKKDIRRD